jgi:hypothetical protein
MIASGSDSDVESAPSHQHLRCHLHWVVLITVAAQEGGDQGLKGVHWVECFEG